MHIRDEAIQNLNKFHFYKNWIKIAFSKVNYTFEFKRTKFYNKSGYKIKLLKYF